MSFLDKASDQIKNLPTSGHFCREMWDRAFLDGTNHSADDVRIYSAGIWFGEFINENDSRYKALISHFPNMHFSDLIAYVNYESLKIVGMKGNEREGEVNALLETIIDSAQVVFENLDTLPIKKDSESKIANDQLQAIFKNISVRVFLADKWQKVKTCGWEIKKFENGLLIRPVHTEREFQRLMGISRLQDHLSQLQAEILSSLESGKNKGLKLLAPLKYVPTVITGGGKKEITYEKPSIQHAIISHKIFYQVPFYFAKFANFNLKGIDNITLIDIAYAWILLYVIADLIKARIIKINNFDIPKILDACSFNKKELISIFSKSFEFEENKSEALLYLFSYSISNRNDIWLRPLILEGDLYYLLPVAILTGNFLRVCDQIYFQYIENEKIKRGFFFENAIVDQLNEELVENIKLRDTYCKAFLAKINYPGLNNEEVDIIVRIGKTYLIIESKSFKYQTTEQGFMNILAKVEASNITQKREAFIKFYDDFKRKRDVEANFQFDPQKVFAGVGCQAWTPNLPMPPGLWRRISAQKPQVTRSQA